MKSFTIKLDLCFPMKDGETKEEAENRLFDGLDNIIPGYVSSYNGNDVKIIEYKDEEG